MAFVVISRKDGNGISKVRFNTKKKHLLHFDQLQGGRFYQSGHFNQNMYNW